jgi:uncharacterized protein (UPF0332 family)
MQGALFLETARRLSSSSDPADCRTAVSRAYYAVFNRAVEFLLGMGFQKIKRDPHGNMKKRLAASGDAAIESLGSNMHDFHEDRVSADYYLDKQVTEKQATANAAVKKADTMFAIFAACEKDSARMAAIKAALKKANISGMDHLVI